MAAPGDRCPRSTEREQCTTGGLYPSGIREISAPVDVHREAKDGKSLTSQRSHPKRNAPALPASRVVSTRFALAHQTPSAAQRTVNPFLT